MTRNIDESLRAPTQSETERELFAEKKTVFLEALECLYIKNNASGRLMFAEKWPSAATQIFPQELVRFDHDGVNGEEDRAKRAELELEAEIIREKMEKLFINLDSRLVNYGTLQKDELDKIMGQIDRSLAEYVFSETFVNRYFPAAKVAPAAPAAIPETASAINTADSASPSEENAPISSTDSSSAPTAAPAIFSAPSAPAAPPTPVKTMIEVPDTPSKSIGHVDHSYSAGVKGDASDDEDTSWLDSGAIEDEFDGVTPISTSGNEAASSSSSSSSASAPPQTAPSSMGLKAYQSQTGTPEPLGEDVSSASPINVPQAEPTPAPDSDAAQVPPVSDALGEDAKKPDKKPALRIPSLDNIDSHMPNTSRKPEFPPIPGSDDDY